MMEVLSIKEFKLKNFNKFSIAIKYLQKVYIYKVGGLIVHAEVFWDSLKASFRKSLLILQNIC